MKAIPLTQGKVALVDDEDYERLSNFSWSAHCDTRNGLAVWYVRCTKYLGKDATGKHKYKTLHMHREVLGVSCIVDHRNHNPLDNRKSNLRECTQRQNTANRRPNKGQRFKGVSRYKGGRWKASIANKHLGYFSTEEEAARAYDRRALELYGEFARLNFPDPMEMAA